MGAARPRAVLCSFSLLRPHRTAPPDPHGGVRAIKSGLSNHQPAGLCEQSMHPGQRRQARSCTHGHWPAPAAATAHFCTAGVVHYWWPVVVVAGPGNGREQRCCTACLLLLRRWGREVRSYCVSAARYILQVAVVVDQQGALRLV